MDATQRPAVVIDNGSGSTKLGFGKPYMYPYLAASSKPS